MRPIHLIAVLLFAFAGVLFVWFATERHSGLVLAANASASEAELLALQADDVVIHGLEERLAALEPRIRELDTRKQRTLDAIGRTTTAVGAEEKKQAWLRDKLTDCIGCGCLSLRACALYNPEDRAAVLGSGPRYLLGDTPGDVSPTDRLATT